jgi:hypothetical protein
MMMKRPLSVSIVAGFLFIATFIAWAVASALLRPTRFTEWIFTLNPPARAAFETLGRAASLLLYALGLGTLAAGIGLRRGRRWAWWFAIILFTVNVGGDVVALFAIQDWARSGSGILIGLMFLAVLLQTRVRSFCRDPP